MGVELKFCFRHINYEMFVRQEGSWIKCLQLRGEVQTVDKMGVIIRIMKVFKSMELTISP